VPSLSEAQPASSTTAPITANTRLIAFISEPFFFEFDSVLWVADFDFLPKPGPPQLNFHSRFLKPAWRVPRGFRCHGGSENQALRMQGLVFE
jgi:hypothetical protein